MKFAFFDVDGTILSHANSEVLFIKHLFRMHAIPAVNYWFVLSNLIRRINNLEVAFHENKHYLRGLDREFIEFEAQSFFNDSLRKRISISARHEISRLMQAGIEVVLLSAAPLFLVQLVSHDLGVDGYIGTNFEVHDQTNRYSGKIIQPQPYGLQKKIIADQFLKNRGCSFDECVVYANALSDSPLLRSARTAVVVNSNPILARIAQKNLWSIEYWH